MVVRNVFVSPSYETPFHPLTSVRAPCAGMENPFFLFAGRTAGHANLARHISRANNMIIMTRLPWYTRHNYVERWTTSTHALVQGRRYIDGAGGGDSEVYSKLNSREHGGEHCKDDDRITM